MERRQIMSRSKGVFRPDSSASRKWRSTVLIMLLSRAGTQQGRALQQGRAPQEAWQAKPPARSTLQQHRDYREEAGSCRQGCKWIYLVRVGPRKWVRPVIRL